MIKRLRIVIANKEPMTMPIIPLIGNDDLFSIVLTVVNISVVVVNNSVVSLVVELREVTEIVRTVGT